MKRTLKWCVFVFALLCVVGPAISFAQYCGGGYGGYDGYGYGYPGQPSGWGVGGCNVSPVSVDIDD